MTEIAVVVPTHNRAELLALTLQSVLAQQGVDLVVAVVDDGSSDPRAVRAVVEALGDRRVRLFRHDTPRGVSAARNTGIANTSSDWVAFCDDDDVWAPEKLKAQLTVAGGGAGWAYTGQVAIDGDLRALDGAPPLGPFELVSEIEHYNPVPAGSSNVVVRRSVLDEVGSFDSSLLSVGDWDLWIRLARHSVPACVPEPLVGCRVHGLTITRNRRLMLAEVGVVARRHGVAVDWPRHYRWAAWNSVLDGQRLEMLTHYGHAIARGDLASIGRCIVALVHPGIAHRRRAGAISDWVRSAEGWLAALRSAPPVSTQVGSAISARH
jgi:glycosyltransferase involved in cell wall biosynthesis